MTSHGLPRLIGLGGRLRSGKDTIADHLVAHHGYLKIGMSDVILEHVLVVNPWIRVRLTDAWSLRRGWRFPVLPGFHRARGIVEGVGYVDAKTVRDFREYMWRDGTDGGRDYHHDNIWVDKMDQRLRGLLEQGHRVVITGVRYPNELAMTRQNGAWSLWVARSSADGAAKAHKTEASLEADDFDIVISNDGTLADLHDAADVLILGGEHARHLDSSQRF